MKNLKLIILAFCIAAMATGCAGTGKTAEYFAKGADISWITEMEANGDRFYNADGEETDLFVLLKQLGLNAVRLRVWVDPSEHGGWCDKWDFLAKAKRAAAEGLDILVCFHYSDWWTDPGVQTTPKAWLDYDYERMKQAVADHTTEVLTLLKDNGITPKWVQCGNEECNGILWPTGEIHEHPDQYAGLYMAGYNAVKAVFPDCLVLVHLDNGFDQSMYDWHFDVLREHGAKWDMIGMSLYPYWAIWAGKDKTAESTISRCIANISHVYEKYGTDVMIVETGVTCNDGMGGLAPREVLEEGRDQMQRIIDESLATGHCKGIFYWEPQARPSRYNLGAFTEDGRATIIMDPFAKDYPL